MNDFKALTRKEANYIYAALMRNDLAIPANSPQTPKTIYIYADPTKALNPTALSYFKRTIKALYSGKKELAQHLFEWGMENA